MVPNYCSEKLLNILRCTGALALVVLLLTSYSPSEEKQLLHYSIVGGSSCATKPCFWEALSSVAVQRVLLDLTTGPRAASDIENVLKGSTVTSSDLLTLGLLRREGSQYVLNFALFTSADKERIRRVSEKYADSLAAALISHRTEIESLLEAYDAPGVDRKAVAYYVLGCASLDWDGLNMTAAEGYRTESGQRPDGDYVPAAEEIDSRSLERVYFGSSKFDYGGAHWTSFGDHYSPRYTFPDLFWDGGTVGPWYPEQVRTPMLALVRASVSSSAGKMTAMMLALRSGKKTLAQLAEASALKEEEARPLLDSLIAFQFVTKQDATYATAVPVLTERDEAMTRKLIAIGHRTMEEWLAENYPKMKSELQDLSFTRSGVPYENGYTMIWHYLFGITNRKLVEAGLFSDPYAPERKYKGFIPAISTLRLP